MTNYQKYIDLLCALVGTPSLSKQEDKTAEILKEFLLSEGVNLKRLKNNFVCYPRHYYKSKKTIVLNSHHDTVAAKDGWTKDPFSATIEDGKLYGRGSNDAGGCLVALIATFIHYQHRSDLDYNLFLIISAEEEISGPGGLRHVLPLLDFDIDLAIVGEPTLLDMAIAEKGLIVIDAVSKGRSGHAANQWGDNAITEALQDIAWIEQYRFDKGSSLLGEVKLTVTQINAGTQHNVVPDECHYVVDCRINEHYDNEDIVELIKYNCKAIITPRSTHLRSSSISEDHPIVTKGKTMGMKTYGSPTMSDQVFFRCPSIKIGPGDSKRSHTVDEFIYLEEIENGINTYLELLNNLKLS